MNILLTLSFVGTRYHGFQVQKNALAVCTVLQDAMQCLFGERPPVKGCSRTDSGVHAREYALSFRYETSLPDAKLPLGLNAFLPPDIRVKTARRVPEDFHARYSALGKEYEYVILNAPVDDPFAAGLYYRVSHPLDASAMHKAGQALVGKHDFAAFMSAGSGVQDTVRTITHLSVRRQDQSVIMAVAADGFLYNMVRIIAGTLLWVGEARHPPNKVAATLAGQNRAQAGEKLPARGVFLNRVFYPQINAENPATQT